MAQKITTKTNIEKEMILKAIAIREKNENSFIVGHFYKIENINKDIVYNPGIKLNGSWYAQWELIDYFEIVDFLDDVEDLENKALIFKETFEQIKEMSKDDEFEMLSIDPLIQETINFLISDEKFQGNEIELRFICDNMDITMVEQCSCCGKILLPDDEVYEDEINNGESLCEHCSIFNEDTNMYQKALHKDVIEKITGLKFSPHIGNIGSKVEEFNYWLREIDFKDFGFKKLTYSKDYFVEFIQEKTEWNICDCCGLIEISTDLIWDSDEVYDQDYQNFRFLRATSIASDAFCKGCLDLAGQIAKPDLETITSRIIENNLIFRVGEFVLLENVEWDNKPKTNNLIAKISSIDETKETYTLEEYGDVEFKEDEFYDVINEAYLMEYGDFISDNYSDLSGKVAEWTSPNHEGIADIDYAFENFGYKNEFIEYLKSKDLPYGRFLESNFKNESQYKVGDIVTVNEDMIDSSKDIVFLENLLGRTLEIEEVTDEYKDPQVSTYKCIDFETREVVRGNILPNEYFPFVDSDLKKFTELKKDK